jgi:hypothetical protein
MLGKVHGTAQIRRTMEPADETFHNRPSEKLQIRDLAEDVRVHKASRR